MKRIHLVYLLNELAKASGMLFVTCKHPSCTRGKWPDGADCAECYGSRLMLEPQPEKDKEEPEEDSPRPKRFHYWEKIREACGGATGFFTCSLCRVGRDPSNDQGECPGEPAGGPLEEDSP